MYVPDYLNGDPVPSDAFTTGKVCMWPSFSLRSVMLINALLSLQFNLGAWFENHSADRTRPPLDKLVDGLKAKGITAFGAVGYCFGGRYVFDLAFDGVLKVAVVSHPSLIEVADLEKFKMTGIPLLINSCEFDPVYGAEKQKTGDEILGDGKTEGPVYKRTYWLGCAHGFAVRGDVNDPFVKAGREGVFKATVEWFIEYL